MAGKLPVQKHRLNHQPLLLILLSFVIFSGCSLPHPHISIAKDAPPFIDDGDTLSLKQALYHQQAFVRNQNGNGTLQLDGKTYTHDMLEESLAAFAEIVEMDLSPMERDRFIKEQFTIFQAGGLSRSKDKEMLITGYFEPVLQGSLKKEPPFIYPIYAVPADLTIERDEDGNKQYGRIGSENGNVIRPYWTREEIDGSSVLQGSELVYLKDRFDAFLLHVQGSGKIQLQNGEVRTIRYAGNNGHPYTSIGKVLVDEKKLTLKEASIPTIRRYLSDHPGEITRVLNQNRRYIFFAWGTGASPQGSSGVPLTPERSVAIDRSILPMKTVAFLLTERPVLDKQGNISHWQPMHRFVFPQDTGAAIKGSGRVDIFWGSGEYAEKAAGSMRQKGMLYFLIKKDTGKEQ